jgi:hypothetical protein
MERPSRMVKSSLTVREGFAMLSRRTLGLAIPASLAASSSFAVPVPPLAPPLLSSGSRVIRAFGQSLILKAGRRLPDRYRLLFNVALSPDAVRDDGSALPPGYEFHYYYTRTPWTRPPTEIDVILSQSLALTGVRSVLAYVLHCDRFFDLSAQIELAEGINAAKKTILLALRELNRHELGFSYVACNRAYAALSSAEGQYTVYWTGIEVAELYKIRDAQSRSLGEGDLPDLPWDEAAYTLRGLIALEERLRSRDTRSATDAS